MPATITPPSSPANTGHKRVAERNSPRKMVSATNTGAAAPSFEPPKATKVASSVTNYQTRWEREKAKARAEGTDIETGDPKMIGPWVIGEMLGRGASGRVRLARHFRTGKMAAVKILNLHPSLASQSSTSKTSSEKTEKMRLTAEREIAVMKLLDHPNIMKMYDVWSSPKELYLVLEYVQGGELFDYLCSRGSRLSLLEAIAIIKQVLAGVDYCHRFHICHRDLKPENILLTNDGTGNDQYKRVKIADFGMSALDSLNGLLRTSCGSPHYASPEIVRGHTYSGATSDIWSCGVILYALLTSRLPFDDPNVNNVLRKVRDGRFTIPEWVAPPAKDLLIRMLEVDLSKRITMRDIFQHPLLQLDTPGIVLPPMPKIEEYALPVAREHVDADLLRSLCIIWREKDSQSMVARLCSDTRNFEKAFYFLLCLYRDRSFEEYNMEYPSSSHSSSLMSTPASSRPGTPIRDLRQSEEMASPIRRHFPGKVNMPSQTLPPAEPTKQLEIASKSSRSPPRPRVLSDANVMIKPDTRTRSKTLREEHDSKTRARSESNSSTRSRSGSSPNHSSASTPTKRSTRRRSSTSAPRIRGHAPIVQAPSKAIPPPSMIAKERVTKLKPPVTDLPTRAGSPTRVSQSLVRQLASVSAPVPARAAVKTNRVIRPLADVAEERPSQIRASGDPTAGARKRSSISRREPDTRRYTVLPADKSSSDRPRNPIRLPLPNHAQPRYSSGVSREMPAATRLTSNGLGVFLSETPVGAKTSTSTASSTGAKDVSRATEESSNSTSSGETWEQVEWSAQDVAQNGVKNVKPRRKPAPLDLLNPYHRDRRTQPPQPSPPGTPKVGSPLLHPFMNFSALSWATPSPLLASPIPGKATTMERDSSSQSTAPPPVGSRGILARFFDWKSPDLQIISGAGPLATRGEVTRLLSLCDATFLQTENGGYRCRIDEFVDAEGQHIAKNVRFRIMVSPLCQGLSHGWSLGTGLPARQSESLLQTNFPSPGSGRVTGCLVTLAQEKGAYSVLKMVHQRMIKHWSLEGPLGPTYASTTHLPPMPVSAGFDSPVPVISYAKSSM